MANERLDKLTATKSIYMPVDRFGRQFDYKRNSMIEKKKSRHNTMVENPTMKNKNLDKN